MFNYLQLNINTPNVLEVQDYLTSSFRYSKHSADGSGRVKVHFAAVEAPAVFCTVYDKIQTEDFLKLLFLMNVFHLLGIWLTTKASCVINVFAIKYLEYESCAFALLCSASLTPSPSPCWKINIITEDERLHASVTVAAILSKEL